jgi:uncharacterized protein with von Willebrand factor type A (vWA) domain
MTAAYATARHTDATRTVSRWADYLFTSRGASSTTLRSARAEVSRAFAAHAKTSTDTQAEARRLDTLATSFAREVFAGLYDAADTVALDKPAPDTQLVQRAHDQLAALPEYQQLAAQVAGDPDLAALATAQLLRGVAGALPQVAEQERQQAQQDAQQALGRAQRGPKADADGAMRRAMRAACADAAQATADAADAMDALAPGLGETPAQHEQDGTARMSLAERVSSDARLKRVMKLAGRLRRLASDGRKVRDDLGASTLVGTTIGGDLPRALPTELGLLRHARLRRVQLAKLADRRLQQYHVVGDVPKGRGPIVVLLDESSSMEGERSLWATAVALACLGTAARERRACTVIGFNGSVRYVVRLDAAGKAWRHSTSDMALATAMGGCAEVALHVASSRPNGGTDFAPALRAALQLEDGVTRERADLVLVTDGHAEAPTSVMQALTAAKEDGLRVFGLTVGGGSLGHAVRQLTDHVVDLDAASSSDDSKAVANALP